MAVTFLTNEDGKKFVKSINNIQPDENGNVKITVENQDVDLTGYATEKWVQEGYQQKGNYLTKVPDEYATEEFVIDKIAEAEIGGKEVDLSGYAKKSELPTKVSQLDNDSGYLTEHQDISGKLDANKLTEAINTALAQAKDSGEFDGYTPVKNVDYFDGKDGEDGKTPEKGIDYFTEADKTEIARQAADLVDIPDLDEVYILSENETLSDVPDGITVVIDPDGNPDFDLTSYATKNYVNDYAQPKGNYLTEVPKGYAKTEDIPTKPEDIGAQPSGNYLTKVPDGYAKTEDIPTDSYINSLIDAKLAQFSDAEGVSF